MSAQKLASLEDSGRKLNAELKANSEKTVVVNLLLQDCNKKLSEAVSRSNWDESQSCSDHVLWCDKGLHEKCKGQNKNSRTKR